MLLSPYLDVSGTAQLPCFPQHITTTTTTTFPLLLACHSSDLRPLDLDSDWQSARDNFIDGIVAAHLSSVGAGARSSTPGVGVLKALVDPSLLDKHLLAPLEERVKKQVGQAGTLCHCAPPRSSFRPRVVEGLHRMQHAFFAVQSLHAAA